jgi:hypothetical protein
MLRVYFRRVIVVNSFDSLRFFIALTLVIPHDSPSHNYRGENPGDVLEAPSTRTSDNDMPE